MRKVLSLLFVLMLSASACGRSDSAAPGDEGVAESGQSDAGDSSRLAKSVDKTGRQKAAKKTSEAKGDGGSAASRKARSAERTESDTGAPSDTAGPSASRGASPLSAGTYSYDTDGTVTVSGNRRPLPENTTLTADPPQGDVQRLVRDLRDSDGNGTVTETKLMFADDGVYLTYVKVTSKFPGGLTDVREFKLDPPELIAPRDIEPGFSRSFEMEGSGTRANVRIKALGFDDVTVDSRTIRALVVDTRIVFSGALEGEQNSRTWFWTKHILALREQVDSDVTNGPIRVQSEYEAVLRELEPS
ncbi:MAG: hypothetical protein ABR505_09325 [Actinomycetota bacterium]